MSHRPGFFAVLALGLSLGCAGLPLNETAVSASAQNFTNPTFSGGDPWITFVNGNYYYSRSYCGVGDICVKSSSTLTGLANASWVGVWNHGQNIDPNGDDIWAPELHYINGGWYIYYAADNGDNANHHLFVLTTSGGPASPFSEANTGLSHGQLTESTGNWAIDPDVFTAADGKLYITWSCTNQHNSSFPQRICLAPMSDPVTIAGATTFLSTPSQTWETRGAAIQEGPVGYTRNSRTYITYSGSASWIANDYSVGLLRLASGGNPTSASAWTKSGPIFDHHGTTYGPGSVVFVPSPNGSEYWNLYHGIDSTSCSPAYNCRDIRMQKMYFDAVGYPVLGYPVNPNVTLTDPSGEGGVTGGTTLVPDFGDAWGDAAEGNTSAGLVTGSWTHSDRFSATSSTGGSWDQIFSPWNPDPTNVTAHVEVQMVTQGTTRSFPKYGFYCTYDDSNNHAELLIDPVYKVLASHAVVNGSDQAWQNVTVPTGFVPTQWHSLDCAKSGSTYTFKLDSGTPNAISYTRNFTLNNGQTGLVVVDIKANYRNLQLTPQ